MTSWALQKWCNISTSKYTDVERKSARTREIIDIYDVVATSCASSDHIKVEAGQTLPKMKQQGIRPWTKEPHRRTNDNPRTQDISKALFEPLLLTLGLIALVLLTVLRCRLAPHKNLLRVNILEGWHVCQQWWQQCYANSNMRNFCHLARRVKTSGDTWNPSDSACSKVRS